MKLTALTIFACALYTALPSYAGNTCEVKSNVSTAALVELYTSEGCSNCPPADKQLSRVRELVGPSANVVPLSLHVSYWDSIGWKDVFAKKAFDDRQSELLANKQSRVVYTPQFFVNGNELRSWRDNLPSAIRQINARPAPVVITLKTSAGPNNTIMLDAIVKSIDVNAKISGDLYVAISENGLTSRVLRGENGGVTLHHDNTVRLWYGPIHLLQGNAQFKQEVKLPVEWNRQNLNAIAFVQDQRDGNVLQVVSTAKCMPTAT
ncbi:Uncharacterized conserved protein [Janthinobacterium sp. Marseille]|uniref:DUF1223 domain-containing protein n=1 Tax=Herminiimonas aquatilis TaxID=345342 RepID=A0ABW2J5L0_9BURK|nr:DUF1223 domain-containing protein [Janthinobacterium sp. Marseille]ABR91390.1 Uncharacterized conserved protein [Janthinobacterium sp. Marseille]